MTDLPAVTRYTALASLARLDANIVGYLEAEYERLDEHERPALMPIFRQAMADVRAALQATQAELLPALIGHAATETAVLPSHATPEATAPAEPNPSQAETLRWPQPRR